MICQVEFRFSCAGLLDRSRIARVYCQGREDLDMSETKEKKADAFGRRLRALRQGAGLTQSQVAARAGCSYITLARFERGTHHASDAMTKRLAAALGVGLEAFAPGSTVLPPGAKGSRLRLWRQRQGLTMEQAGARAGITRQGWHWFEVQPRLSAAEFARLTRPRLSAQDREGE